MYTGLRVGELCSLKWKDIDIENCTVAINRTVPFPQFMADILKKCKNKDDIYLITSTSKPTEPRVMQNRFHKILKECNLHQINFHMLRHTYATVCIEHGFDAKTLSELLGHADASIALNRYVHSSMKLKHDYVSRLKLSA